MNDLQSTRGIDLTQMIQHKPINFMTGFIKKKRPLIILVGIMSLLFVLLKIFINANKPFTVFEFGFIAFLFGIAPAYYFRKLFPIYNIIGWLTYAGVLSTLLIPLIFLLAGWLGINFVFSKSITFLYVSAILGVLSLFIFADEEEASKMSSLHHLQRVDIFSYVIILAFSGILTLLNFSHLYPRWDTFTFWGLDANYIFQFNKLRDSTFNVTGTIKYTSFYPIFYSIIYDLYGTIVEQYASWVNVFINFSALMTIYNLSILKNNTQKILVVILMVLTSYGAINAAFMFSIYADVLCAFILMFYASIIIYAKPEITTFGKRCLLVLLTSTSLFLIKDGFFIISLLLVITWIYYDHNFIIKNRQYITKNFGVWFSILIICVILIMRNLYFNNFTIINSSKGVLEYYSPKIINLSLALDYLREMVTQLAILSPYLFWLWILGISLIFFMKNISNFRTQFIFLFFLTFTIFLFFCFSYLIAQTELVSKSLIRYTSIVMYLIPILISLVPITLPSKVSYPVNIGLILMLGWVLMRIFEPIFQNNFSILSDGSYKSPGALQNYYTLSKNVLEITGNDAKILIADEDDNQKDLYTNMLIPEIYIRYYLANNSVGGQYRWIKWSELINFAEEQNADYILLLSYQNEFNACGDMLIDGHDYLIKIGNNAMDSIISCLFDDQTITDVTIQ